MFGTMSPSTNETTQKLICELWRYEDKFKVLHEIEIRFMGEVSGRHPKTFSLKELEQSTFIFNQIDDIKNELRKRLGFWKYLYFYLFPLKFYKKLINN